MPAGYRNNITINRDATVEIDFSWFHPTILYAMAGEELLDDPYLVEGLDIRHRGFGKEALNAIINAPSRSIRIPEEYNSAEIGMSFKGLREKLEKKHHPIANTFYSGGGVNIQSYDAELCEKILLDFSHQNIPIPS